MNLTEKSKLFFKEDIFATELAKIEIEEVQENYAKCRMNITPQHLNANGVVMGGAIYTLADFTFAVASNSVKISTVTLNSNINFISSSKAQALFAESKHVKNGNSICFFETSVYEQSGKLIATVTSTGFKIK